MPFQIYNLISGENLSNPDTLGTKKVSWLVRCPYFRGSKAHKHGIWAGKLVSFIIMEVVLISGSPD